MGNIVRAALLQTDWPGSKAAMLDKHEQAMHDAKAQGAQVMCFQELFYGPYFCQVQDPEYYQYTEEIPDGPTSKRFNALAKETGMVLVLLLHMLSVLCMGSYKSPREFNWLTGFILLTMVQGISLTGYLLPWDQLAYWAITIGAAV